jgi:MFS transporter, AAHS family, 4-hydroxybenzoate transporter
MKCADRVPKISELIDQRGLSRYQLVTMLLCGLVLMLDGFATQSIGFLAPSIAMSLHLPLRSFGPVFAAALFGLMLSSMLAGPIADRVGRKGPIIASALIFGTFTIMTTMATSFQQLVVLRFLTGLGLGGAIPNVVALATEYAPKRLQQIVVTVLFCGMPLGALLGGIISSVMLPRWGWQSVFWAGGILPLVVALFLIRLLPESLRFLSLRVARRTEIDRIVAKIAPEAKQFELDASTAKSQGKPDGAPVIHLFTEGRAAGTILLWVPFFMNLLMLYFIVNWLPALLRETHMPLTAGLLAVSLFSLGGILGSFLQGYAMKRFGSRLLLLEFALCFLLIWSMAYIESYPLMMTVVFLSGCFVQGTQAGLNALAATYYPTSIRSTGVGWALGVGRLGSILGPILGGMMLSHNWGLQQIFFAGTIPALLAVLAILLASAIRSGDNPYRSA